MDPLLSPPADTREPTGKGAHHGFGSMTRLLGIEYMVTYHHCIPSSSSSQSSHLSSLASLAVCGLSEANFLPILSPLFFRCVCFHFRCLVLVKNESSHVMHGCHIRLLLQTPGTSICQSSSHHLSRSPDPDTTSCSSVDLSV